jgi:hypothetical protein
LINRTIARGYRRIGSMPDGGATCRRPSNQSKWQYNESPNGNIMSTLSYFIQFFSFIQNIEIKIIELSSISQVTFVHSSSVLDVQKICSSSDLN